MKINIPDVTLIAISSAYNKETIKALEICSENINFGKINFLSNLKPENLPKNMEYFHSPEIKSIDDYNEFIFKNLGDYVKTSHCLLIQYHAYICDYSSWNNNWLLYDYIGAPWGIVNGAYMANDGTRSRVGNGGFSLRSKKILDIPKQNNWELRSEQGWKNEDGNICCYYKKELLDLGIKYAPVEVAASFSYENPVPENYGIPSFGFHKFMNPANKMRNL